MIDWWELMTNLLWACGLAVSLAALSHADWRASRRGQGLRSAIEHVLQNPGFILGIALACLGAGLGVSECWARILWLLLAAGFASKVVWDYLRRIPVRQREDSSQ